MEDDKQLIQSAVKGDKSAFEALMLKYNKWVYGFVFNILHDENVGLDMVQETFIKAYQNLHKFDTRKNFSTWLFAIAKNNTFNYLKTNKRRNEVLTDDSNINPDTRADDSSNPEKTLEKKEASISLAKAIDKLPEKYRVLIHMKYINNMSYAQISDTLGIPTGIVESRLYTARQKLLILLNEGDKNDL